MMDGSWDIRCNGQFFVILGHCLLFALLQPQKIIFENMKKKQLEILSFYTCAPYIKITWYMVPEISQIWSVTDRQNFLSFWAIVCPLTLLKTRKINILKNDKDIWRYYHFTEVHQKSWSNAILFLRYSMWWT